MTSVEFIREKLFCDEYWYEKLTFEQIIEQAKEIHEKEMKDYYVAGLNAKEDIEYYDEKFGTSHRDTPRGDTYTKEQLKLTYMQGYNRGVDGNPNQMESYIASLITSSQAEMLDEMTKIEKALYHAWSDYEYQEGNLYSTTFRDGWLMAIDWYKKQLKQKP